MTQKIEEIWCCCLKQQTLQVSQPNVIFEKVVAAGATHESVSASKTKEEDDTITTEENNKAIEEGDEIVEQCGSDSQKEGHNVVQPKRTAVKRNFHDVDAKMISYIDQQLKPKQDDKD